MNELINIICRYPQEQSTNSDSLTNMDLIEKIFRTFLLSSFESEEIYVISPWFSNFNLSNNVFYHPYLGLTNNVIEIFEKLVSKGIKLHILTRCIDDFIKSNLIYVAYYLQKKSLRVDPEIREYLLRELSNMRDRIFGWIKIMKFGSREEIDFKVDLGLSNRRYESGRLHSKIYVNDYMAIMGSSNFTRSGVVTGGNWECIIVISSNNSNNELYSRIKEYAVKYMLVGKDIYECMQRTFRFINKLVEPLNIKINTLDDLIVLLEDSISYLKSI